MTGLLRNTWRAVFLATVMTFPMTIAQADSSKYPVFAQQSLPADIKPEFIGIEQLVRDISAGAKPVIIDVRTPEEFREIHILGAVSAPLDNFESYIKTIPRDRPVVLY